MTNDPSLCSHCGRQFSHFGRQLSHCGQSGFHIRKFLSHGIKQSFCLPGIVISQFLDIFYICPEVCISGIVDHLHAAICCIQDFNLGFDHVSLLCRDTSKQKPFATSIDNRLSVYLYVVLYTRHKKFPEFEDSGILLLLLCHF